MKLITFQSLEALQSLINNGYLECNEKYIDIQKFGPTYQWVVEKMNQVVTNKNNVKYPIWCWVKCYNNICPPKHKGKPVDGFDVKITFHKNKEEVFITDFRRYSFLLNNTYIPLSLKDKKRFDSKLSNYNITSEDLRVLARKNSLNHPKTNQSLIQICDEIKKSFDRCITTDSDILQGCVWRINLEDIDKIEFLKDKSYRYGSLNYIRSNGKRIDWQKDFYKKLK